MKNMVRMNKAFNDVQKSNYYNALKRLNITKPEISFTIDNISDGDEPDCYYSDITIKYERLVIHFTYFDDRDEVSIDICDTKNHYVREIDVNVTQFDFNVINNILKEEIFLQFA